MFSIARLTSEEIRYGAHGVQRCVRCCLVIRPHFVDSYLRDRSKPSIWRQHPTKVINALISGSRTEIRFAVLLVSKLKENILSDSRFDFLSLERRLFVGRSNSKVDIYQAKN